jgi:N-acetylglucosamine kinase-like BadF-type ATPase
MTQARRVDGVLVGVDAGATKTLAVAFDPGTEDLRVGTGPSGNAVAVGFPAASEAVLQAIAGAVGSSEIVHAVVAIAGVDDSRWHGILRTSPGLTSANFTVVNDAVAAWAAVDEGRDAVVLIAGTGSHALAVVQGERIRLGGWGHVFGDEGSGYWIGREGVREAVRQLDRREPAGELARVLLEARGAADVATMVGELYAQGAAKAEVAALARAVDRAATAGDSAALAIFKRAARELHEHVEALARLDPRTASLPVGLVGSAWRSEHLRRDFAELALGRDVRLVQRPPAMGALSIAASIAGCEISGVGAARAVGR